MEILRIPSYSIEAKIPVSLSLTSYDYSLTDMTDSSVSTGTAVSDSSSAVTIQLPENYDGSYLIEVDNEEHQIDVVRPYVDPTTMGDTASEISDYFKHEEIARAIIDSVIEKGFYYKKEIIEATGNGSDYLPLWTNVRKVLKVYENNVLVFDADNPDDYEFDYGLSDDKTSVIQRVPDTINRAESAGVFLPISIPDTSGFTYYLRSFPSGYNYTIVAESGYKRLPSDIVRSAELLADDFACGRLDYYKRYVADYNTDQFKLKFDSKVFEGTGNLVVDKILSKYFVSITRLGVL
jgi:hypothetical protein